MFTGMQVKICLNVCPGQNTWNNSAKESLSLTMTIWAKYKNKRCQKRLTTSFFLIVKLDKLG